MMKRRKSKKSSTESLANELTPEQLREHLAGMEPKHPETNLAGWWERQGNKVHAISVLGALLREGRKR